MCHITGCLKHLLVQLLGKLKTLRRLTKQHELKKNARMDGGIENTGSNVAHFQCYNLASQILSQNANKIG
jgi:hypothetical protein